jgi:hypothetical protein
MIFTRRRVPAVVSSVGVTRIRMMSPGSTSDVNLELRLPSYGSCAALSLNPVWS